MSTAFSRAGYSDKNCSLDLSKWNVNKVTEYEYFSSSNSSRISNQYGLIRLMYIIEGYS